MLEKIVSNAKRLFLVIGVIYSLDFGMEVANRFRNRQAYSISKVKPYSSFSQARELIKEIKEDLNLSQEEIFFSLFDKERFVGCCERRPSRYSIKIHPDHINELTLAHELYHAYQHSKGKAYRFPILRGFTEWGATSYSLKFHRQHNSEDSSKK